MALVRATTDRRDLCYAIVRVIEADKSGVTRVNVGLWYDQEDRFRAGADTVPAARDARSHTLSGYGLSLPEIYDALAALPDWAGWQSDEDAAVAQLQAEVAALKSQIHPDANGAE